jgi:site-specific DNA recombinase
MGRIFDDRDNRMTPSHSRKEGMRHRYYVSSALIQGRPEAAGSVSRVPAAKIEAIVVEAVRHDIEPDATADNAELIAMHVDRIEVRRAEIVVSLLSDDRASDDEEHAPVALTLPWSKTARTRHRKVIAPVGATRGETRPIRVETRSKLITAIARGRLWLAEVEAGTATIDDIAGREGCSTPHVNMTISLAFLAPDLVRAAVEGLLPHGVGVARLLDAPVLWPRQHSMLGLS